MIYDVHAHFGLYDVEFYRRELLNTAERYGVTRYYLSNVEGGYYPTQEQVHLDNQTLSDLIKEYPDLLRGYVYANPRYDDALDVVRRGIEEQGMCGLKLWVATYCDDPLVFPLVEQMIEYDKPILIHTFVKAVDQLEFESTSRNVANLAQRYPEAKIIMAHLGGEPCHGIRPVAKYENVWIDHSGTLVGSNDLQHAINLVGVDRILFGSDLPVGFACSYGQVLEAKLTEEEREKILWKNTAKLFGESV